MDLQLSPANSSPLSPFTEPIEPSNGVPSPSSLPSLQTLLHMQSNGKVQAEGSVGRPPSDSSDLSSFDGSDDEPVSQGTKGLVPNEDEDEEDDEEEDGEEDEEDEEDEAEEDEDEEEEPEADLPTPVRRPLHQQPYKQQQQSSPSTSRHRLSHSPIVNRTAVSNASIAPPGSSAYPSTRSPTLGSPPRRAGSRTPTSNRHLRQPVTPSNLISNTSPSLVSASASASVSKPAPPISLLASHVSATQQDQAARVFPPAPQSLSSTLSDSDEEPDEEDEDEDGEGQLDMDVTPEQEQRPRGAVDVDMDAEADAENEDEDEDEDEDGDSVLAERSIRSQSTTVPPKTSVPIGGLEVKTPQDPINLGLEDIQVEEGEFFENDALSETAGINHVKHDHLFVPSSTGIEPIITVEDGQVVSESNGNQTRVSDDIEDQDQLVQKSLLKDKQPSDFESVVINGQANGNSKEETQQQSPVEEKELLEKHVGGVKITEAVEAAEEQSKDEDHPKALKTSTKPDVIITTVDENPSGVLPSHSLLAQQRADALEALLKIEIAFARLRDKFHVERMEQCLKEEEQLLDESHPVLAHFQSRLSDLRARELVYMGKRSKTFEVSLEKVQQADIEAIWEWWRNGREELQRDMMADVMRKRRRVDREKRAVEGGRPKRPLPVPPQNASKRTRQDSQPPDLEDLLPGSFFHHRPEERRRIREEREAIGPRPGLLGLDERSRDVDLQLLGIGSSIRFRPFEQAQHPLMVPPNPMAHHHHHHHPLHPPPPPPPQSTAQLASQQYHNVHYPPGPSHHAMALSGGGSQGIPYPFRQGMPSYPAEQQQHQQQQPSSHQHSNLQSQHQNQHMLVHHQPTLSSSQQQQQASQQQQHNSHPYLFNGLSNGGSFSQPHLSSHPGASFET
ncbi:Sds3-like [Phaffia rhodozyma]|uniref:Sds3-like n=1 Tax=Phaffia rhodozyma TaxID=264483 RepID=A0A0F7SH68_PHARH|nr:Sds3-like [Phaffia rhodozyma]